MMSRSASTMTAASSRSATITSSIAVPGTRSARGARPLGSNPAEVRRRNMIRAEEMPYRVGIPYRDGEPIVYDSGDYPGALAKALDAVGGVAAFRRRQQEARRDG